MFRIMRRVLVLFACETAAVGGLLGVRGAFAPDQRLDDPLATAVWAAALAISTWLALSTLGCLVVEVVPGTPSILRQVMARATLPPVRALITRIGSASVAGSLALGSVAPTVPAGSTPTSTSTSVRTGRDLDVVRREDPRPDPPPPSRLPPGEHQVIVGENLWSIAAIRLAAARGRPVSEPEIARYWVSVVDVNRTRLRSGDPDLIYPGELVTLPAPPG